MPPPTDLRLTRLEEHESPSGVLPPGPDPAAVGCRQLADPRPGDGGGLVVPLELTVANLGDKASDPTEAVIVRSADGLFGPDADGLTDDLFAAAVPIPALAPGEQVVLTVSLSTDPERDGPGGFLLVGVNQPNANPSSSAEPVADRDTSNNANQGIGLDAVRFAPTFPSAEGPDTDEPVSVPLRTTFTGELSSEADRDVLVIDVPEAGRLSVTLVATTPDLDPRVRLLTDSVETAGGTGSAFERHLPAGEYRLEVSAGAGAGGYQLTTEFDPSSPPGEDLPVVATDGRPATPLQVLAADLDADTRPDLLALTTDAAGAVSVLSFVNLGDGSFRTGVHTRLRLMTSDTVPEVRVADLDNDPFPDLLVTDPTTGVFGLLGQGDGLFRVQPAVPVGSTVSLSAVGDVNANQRTDAVVVLEQPTGPAIAVLRAAADGTLEAPVVTDLPVDPSAVLTGLAVADVTGDRVAEVIVLAEEEGGNRLLVFADRGSAGLELVVGQAVEATGQLVVADLFGSGMAADLVVLDPAGGLTLFAGRGDGRFIPFDGERPEELPPAASAVAADLDGDGRIELVLGSRDPVRLRNTGDGLEVGDVLSRRLAQPAEVAVADFDGDGRPDVAAIDVAADGGGFVLTVQPGRPFGAAAAELLPTGLRPDRLLVGDLDGDGLSDLTAVTTDAAGPTFSTLLARAGGGFTAGHETTATRAVTDAGLADLNRDGLADLVTVSDGTATAPARLQVWLGLGDGRFAVPDPSHTFDFAGRSLRLSLVDFTADGRTDAVLRGRDAADRPVLVTFTGDGAGRFRGVNPQPLLVDPFAASVFDAGTGNALLAVGDRAGTVEVIAGSKAGPALLALSETGPNLQAVLLAELDADAFPDLVTYHRADDGTAELLVRRGRADNEFPDRPDEVISFLVTNPATDAPPPTLTLADLSGDGRPDLVVPDGDELVVAVAAADGTFSDVQRIPAAGLDLGRAVVVDLTGDGHPDLVAADATENGLRVLVGGPDTAAGERLIELSPAAAPDRTGTVAVAQFVGDDWPDTLVLDDEGRVLVYPAEGTAPRVVNEGLPATDFVPLRTPAGPAVGILSATGRLVVLRPAADEFVPGGTFAVGRLPVKMAAADRNGDGFTDVAVSDGLSNTITLLLTTPDAGLSVRSIFTTDGPAAELAFADLDADGRAELLVADARSGVLSVVGGQSVAAADEQRFRSVGRPAPVVVAEFDDIPGADVVVVPATGGQAVFLSGTGAGGLAAPVPSVFVGTAATAAVAADFNRDGRVDLAVLDPVDRKVRVAAGDGAGGFAAPIAFAAGPAPIGLTTADVNGDMFLDLLVGDRFGGRTILLGNGDGTFTAPAAAAIPLAAADLDGDGTPDLVLADAANRAIVGFTRGPTGLTEAFRLSGPADPGAVVVADLNGDDIPDLAVTDVSGNQVLVRMSAPTAANRFAFAPAVSIPVGLHPSSLAAADVSGNGRTDLLVGNARSNDLSVLLGEVAADGQPTFAAGPRVATGGFGPASIVPNTDPAGAVTDVVVVHRESGTVDNLSGVGGGFFREGTKFAAVADPTGDGPLPVIDPASRRGFAATDDGGLLTFRGTAAPREVRAGTVGGTGDPLVGLQLLPLADGSGLLTVTATGRVTLDRVAANGDLTTVVTAETIAGAVAAVGVPTAAGVDLFVVSAAGEPTVLAVALIAPPEVQPLPPPPPPPANPDDSTRSPETSPGDLVVDVAPPASDDAARFTPDADGQVLTVSAGISVGGTGGGLGIAGNARDATVMPDQPPADDGDEPAPAWERFYLDLDALGRQFGRPPVVPPPAYAPPPAPGGESADPEADEPQPELTQPRIAALAVLTVGAMGERFRRLVRRRPAPDGSTEADARRPPALPFAGEQAFG